MAINVRAPNKGGGPRNLAYGYESRATPSPTRRKRSETTYLRAGLAPGRYAATLAALIER